MVHLCKMMISPDAFFFSKFLGGGDKGQKVIQNKKQFCLLQSIS